MSETSPASPTPVNPDRIEDIIAEILQEPEDRWQQVLDSVCEREAELASELRRRFSYLQGAGLVDAETEVPRPGRRFGDFQILEQIGIGGMGIVFLAKQISTAREVAVKLIRPELLESQHARRRFCREIELASRVEHPGVCRVYEAGDVGGALYIAMQYVDGERLLDWCDRRRGRVAEVVDLFIGVARALHEAHRMDLVHRDIKPGNILVTRENRGVILDFGLARATDDSAANLTLTSDHLGTPAYMSPEQVDGRGRRIDRRADVYALGVTLYEALTGRLPFEATGRASLFREILTATPTDPRRFSRHITPELSVVLQTAMERDVERRYDSARAFAEDLERVRARQPIRARPAHVGLRLRRWIERNPALAMLFTLLTIGLVLTSVLLFQRDAALRELRLTALIDASAEALHQDPVRALLLARAAVDLYGGSASLSALHEALSDVHERGAIEGHAGTIGGLKLSADDKCVLTWSMDGTARLTLLREPEHAVVLKHPDARGWIMDAAFSPDDSLVVTGSRDGFVSVWNREGTLLASWNGGGQAVLDVQFAPACAGETPNRRTILSSGWNGAADLWEWRRDRPTLRALQAPLRAAEGNTYSQFSPSGRWILTGDSAGDARLYRRAGTRFELHRVLGGHKGVVQHVQFAPDESFVLTAPAEFTKYGRHTAFTDDIDVRIWRLDQLDSPPILMAGFHANITDVAISPDSSSVLAGYMDGSIRIFENLSPWPAREQNFTPAKAITDVAFSADGTRLLVAAGIESRVLDRRGTHLYTLRTSRHRVLQGVFTADGDTLTAGGDTVRTFAENIPSLPVFWGHTKALMGAEFSPDGRFVVTTSRDMTARIWDRSTGRELACLVGHEAPVWACGFSADSKTVVTGSLDGAAWLWDRSGKPLRELVVPDNEVSTPGRHELFVGAARFSPRGDALVTYSDSEHGRVRVWKTTGEHRKTLPHERNRVHRPALTFAPSGDRFATGFSGDDGRVRVWNLAGGLLSTFATKAAWGHALEFSPDGESVVVATVPDGLLVYGLDGTLRETYCGVETLAPLSAAFSPGDGNRIVAGYAQGHTVVWSRGRGEHEIVLRGHKAGIVVAARFSPDDGGKFVLTASADGTARISCVDPAKLRALADQHCWREFTSEERDRYGHLIDP